MAIRVLGILQLYHMDITAFDIAMRFVGVKEAQGVASNPLILAMLRLDDSWPQGDHVPWCSAFVAFVAWLLELPRSRSLAARSWLQVGAPVAIADAKPGNDVVILSRGVDAPGAGVLSAPGHVGWYVGREGDQVLVLGGNQGDAVSVAPFPVARVLGVRRLA
jgi:uncharacterized protein (TIGR02594 family)